MPWAALMWSRHWRRGRDRQTAKLKIGPVDFSGPLAVTPTPVRMMQLDQPAIGSFDRGAIGPRFELQD